MLTSLVRFCVKEAPLVVLLALGLVVFGWYSYQTVPIDAIPNIGENQVIVLTPWPGRSPKDIEDQVTYPLSKSLLAVPGAESVRGKSMFGYSFVQVTFKDSIDFYWARSRVSEQLGSAAARLPDGVTPQLGPDATGLGQVFYYVLIAPKAGKSLAELRSLQDFVVKYELQAVEGVSEVASIGGYVRQYQIEVDPNKLRFHDMPLNRLIQAVKESNVDVGAKTIESSGMEFIIRGKGFLGTDGDTAKAIRDIEQTVIEQRDGVPLRIQDVARVQLGPDFRRGALDYNGGEAVGGVVVMRYGENPRAVIDRVKTRIKQITPSLDGVTIKAIYDRTGLIDETVGTLTTALQEEILITAIVILLFLLHIRSSLIVAATLPMAVLLSFVAMKVFGVSANIMSLAGIAIAIGTMVDMGIIVSENIYQHLADWEKEGSHGGLGRRSEVITAAASEVAPAVVTAVTTTIVSFLPVFFLTGRDYKLFSPLAWTKTFAIVSALLVAITLVPALCRLLLRSAHWPRKASALSSAVSGTLAGLLVYFLWADAIETVTSVAPCSNLCGSLLGGRGWLAADERASPTCRRRFRQQDDPPRIRADPATILALQSSLSGRTTVDRCRWTWRVDRTADSAGTCGKIRLVFGCQAERIARLCRSQTQFHRPGKRRLDRARRRELVLHAHALPCGQLQSGDASAAISRRAHPSNPRSRGRTRQDRPGRVCARPSTGVDD